jgi:hypothetical protein
LGTDAAARAPEDSELGANAEAAFPVADELYKNRRHHLDP